MEMNNLNKENGADRNDYQHHQDDKPLSEYDAMIIKSNNNMPEDTHPPLKPMVKILAMFAAIGGFLFGYDTGVISGAMIQLRDEFNLNTLWQELVVSVTIGAAAVASFSGTFLNDKFGRRPVIILASLIFTLGSVVLALSPVKEVLLVGRLIVGLGVGLAAMTVPMYIAEAAPPHARGGLVTLNNCFVTGGQCIASIVDGSFSYFNWGWRAMLGLGAVPAMIQFIGFLYLPESPRWLVRHGYDIKAREVLQQMHGEDEAMLEYSQIQVVEQEHRTLVEQEAKGQSVFLRVLRDPPVRRALLLGCGLQLIQQLAGINTVMYYSATIVRMSGVKSDTTVIWIAAVIASVNFLGTLIGLYLVNKIGRRTLTLGSLGAVGIVLVFMAACFYIISISSPPIGIVNPEAGPCNQFSSCDSCILDEDCGFCYIEYDGLYVNASGSCLPVDSQHMSNSLIGRCSQNGTADAVWASDFCPTRYGFMAMIGMALYLLAFAPGMGPMPWTINSEIYPMWARSFGNGCATATNWISNLIISMTFLSLTETITRYGTFLLYSGIVVLGFIFLCVSLPETKDKPLEEVIELFAEPVSSCCGGKRTKYHKILTGKDDDMDPSETSSILLRSRRPQQCDYLTLQDRE